MFVHSTNSFCRPFDVVKTRRQMVAAEADAAAPESCEVCAGSGRALNGSGTGTFGHMRRILQREGVGGLWKGNVTRMVKVAPA